MPIEQAKNRTLLTFLRLESLMEQNELSSAQKNEFQELFESLSDAMRPRIARVLLAYEHAKERVRHYLLELRKKLEEVARVRSLSPDDFAIACFRDQTGRAPAGKVELFARLGAVVMACNSASDYERLNHGLPLTKARLSGGFFNEKGLSLHSRSGHRKPYAPVCLIAAKSCPINFQVKVHEEQHFRNFLLMDRFQRAERICPPDVLSPYEEIKDEVFAYIRDGRGWRLLTILQDPLYSDLFEPFSPKEREKVLRTLQEIQETFKSPVMERFTRSQDMRQVILYQLVDTPLERIPRKLSRLVQEFEDYEAEMREVLSPFVSFSDLSAFCSDDISYLLSQYPAFPFQGRREIEERTKEVRTSFRLFFTAPIFLDSGAFMKAVETLKRALEGLRNTLRPVMDNGIFRPQVIPPSPYGFLFAEKKMIFRVCRKASAALLSITPATVDAMLSQEFSDGEEEVRHYFSSLLMPILCQFYQREQCFIGMPRFDQRNGVLSFFISFNLEERSWSFEVRLCGSLNQDHYPSEKARIFRE